MRHPARATWCLTLLVFGGVGLDLPLYAASLTQKLNTVFAPTRVEQASLSRDGQHLAFALRNEADLEIVVYGVDRAERAARLRVDAPPGARVSYFSWLAPERLVVVLDATALLVVDPSARVMLQLDEPKDFALPREKRPGHPAVRVLGAGDEADSMLIELRWSEPDGDVVLDLVCVRLRTFERRLVTSRVLEPGGGAWLVDRQGRPRVLFSFAGLERRYLHLPVDGGRTEAQPLERLVSDGSAAAWRVTPRTVTGERAFPLAFDRDPHVLYYASNVGRDTYGIYALDVRTGAPTGFTIEDPAIDLVDFMTPLAESGLIFDRARQALAGFVCASGPAVARWLEPEFADVQAALEERFSDRTVRVLEWDDARDSFLVRVTAPIDAGRYFIFHRSDGRCVEYQRNPALPPDEANRVEPFAFGVTGGGPVTGTVTWPRAIAGAKPALVVWMHDGPLQQVQPGFQREAQALAAAGFAVAQVNYRGSAGFGRQSREHVREAFDRVPLADALVVVEALATSGDIDRARVAIAGEGFGGYLALRAVQQQPDTFRAAVAINAPLDLAQLFRSEWDAADFQRRVEQSATAGRQILAYVPAPSGEGTAAADVSSGAPAAPAIEPPPQMSGGGPPVPVTFEREFARWFFGPAGRQKNSITAELDRLSRPVILLHDPRLAHPAIGPTRRLREALVRRKQSVEWVELPPTFARGAAAARSSVFRQVGEFLAAQLGAPSPATANAATR